MVRKIDAKLVLRLRAEGFSFAQVASQGISRHSVVEVEQAARMVGMDWEQASKMSGAEVYERLFPGRGVRQSVYVQPDWDVVHKELARVGVTLKLLHVYLYN